MHLKIDVVENIGKIRLEEEGYTTSILIIAVKTHRIANGHAFAFDFSLGWPSRRGPRINELRRFPLDLRELFNSLHSDLVSESSAC